MKAVDLATLQKKLAVVLEMARGMKVTILNSSVEEEEGFAGKYRQAGRVTLTRR